MSSLNHIWAAGVYDGLLERIIHAYKFERVRSACEPLVTIMQSSLPQRQWVVVPVPTAPPRIRQRGYDQAALLAKALAVHQNNVFSPALLRVQYDRQVGKNRMQRQEQSEHMFSTALGRDVQGAHILLVDDVCTTGATFSAAARVLLASGAASVDAVAAAWQPPQA
ncbi:MAG TPA: phosphoribosyltransferase family protein [Candidatus Saccharimonadales bacterium]|nr:phosphoribosyltransferase family protein [Candidatus Saccharimonadales bacterium]